MTAKSKPLRTPRAKMRRTFPKEEQRIRDHANQGDLLLGEKQCDVMCWWSDGSEGGGGGTEQEAAAPPFLRNFSGRPSDNAFEITQQDRAAQGSRVASGSPCCCA